MAAAARPDVGPLRISGRLTDRNGVLGLEDFSAATSEDAALSASIRGSVGDLAAFRGVDLRATLAASQLRGFEPFLEWPLPEIGPLSARARLRDEGDRLIVDEIDVRLGERDATWAEIEGSVLDATRLQGVRIRAEFGAADLGPLRPYLKGEPPDVGPIRGAAQLSDHDGTLGLEHFELRGGREGVFEIHVSGVLDDVLEADEISLVVQVDARDLRLLGQIFDAEPPAIGPIAFSGRFTGSNERLVVEDLTLRLDETELTGSLSGSAVSGERPSLTARLASPRVHLDDIGVEPVSETERPRAPERPGPWWVGAERLPFEQLRAVDLDLDLRADRISGRQGLEVRSARAIVRLDDGDLEVSDASFVYEGGRFEARLLIDTTTPQPDLALIANLKGFDLAMALAQIVENPQGAGLVDANINLQSRGHSIDAIRSKLAGHVDVLMREGYAPTRLARAMELELLDAIIPFETAANIDRPSCFGVELEIEDGVARVESLVLRSSQVTVTGEGTMDIGRRRLDLRLTPTRTRPGLLGAAVAVKIEGPLSDPSITPLKRSIATSAVRGIFSNAMRPDNLLLRPFRDEVVIDASDCDSAR